MTYRVGDKVVFVTTAGERVGTVLEITYPGVLIIETLGFLYQRHVKKVRPPSMENV